MAAYEFVTHEVGGVSDFVFLCSDHAYELLSGKKGSSANVQPYDMRELTVFFLNLFAVEGRSPRERPSHFGFNQISGLRCAWLHPSRRYRNHGFWRLEKRDESFGGLRLTG